MNLTYRATVNDHWALWARLGYDRVDVIVFGAFFAFLTHSPIHAKWVSVRKEELKIVENYLILFFNVDDDFESVDFAENIEPNDLAPSERAENIDLIERPDSDLNEASEIVSDMLSLRFRFWRGVAIINGSAWGSSGPIDFRAVKRTVINVWTL